MKATFTRLRASSLTGNSQNRHLTSIPPPTSSSEYSVPLATLASRILYRSPLPSKDDLPVYVLSAAAFPDSKQVDYDALLPYVLARLPEEEELIGGAGYEVVFFAGWSGTEAGRGRSMSGSLCSGEVTTGTETSGGSGGAAPATGGGKKSRPGWGWFLQAYHVLSRAMRKRLMKLYVVHEKGWIRIVMEMFATIVSPKMRKKVIHVSSLSALAFHIPIEDLLIPPNAYNTDRQKTSEIFAPYASGRRAFGIQKPLPIDSNGSVRLPRVLREATNFVLIDPLIKTEGIFRVSARAQTVEVLKEAFERGQKFIVWRDSDTVLTFPHYREGSGTVAIEELDPLDGYDVHTAAALIKLWYHELREPLLPSSSYQALEKLHSGPKDLTQDELYDLLSPSGEAFTPFPPTSRLILTTHLLPMLSRIADHSDWNRMAPANLATVFAPNLLCGPDPVADLRMAGILQRMLISMIIHWKTLAPVLGCTEKAAFESLLHLPESFSDYEDALQEARNKGGSSPGGAADQMNGIAMLENDNEPSEGSIDEDDLVDDDGQRPPLPPRPSAGVSTEDLTASTSSLSSAGPVRRKPAPAVAALPRYSTIIGDRERPEVLAALSQARSQTYPPISVGNHLFTQTVPEGDDDDGIQNIDHGDQLPSYEQSTPSREIRALSLNTLDLSAEPSSLAESAEQTDSPSSIPRKPVPKG